MAECKECGIEMGFMDRQNAKSYNGQCRACTEKERVKQKLISQGVPLGDLERQRAIEAERASEIEAIVLTTETAPNLNITRRIEIVTAECAFGMNIFKDLFAGIRDIVGGRSEAVQKTMRDSRRTVLYELKKEAHMVGANAVVGVDLDYMEMSTAGSMVLLVASGTAVIIEEI
jgi:uncharacterized protein YbjQ (UPF0145 family)